MAMLSLVIVAFAVSLDGFGVGVMYGLRQLKIPIRSIIVIALCSAATILISMQIGSWLAGFLPPKWAEGIGAFILIGIGIASLWQVRNAKEDPEIADQEQGYPAPEKVEHSEPTIEGHPLQHSASGKVSPILPPRNPQHAETDTKLSGSDQSVLTIEMKRLGLVIQILKTPSAADVDRSGVISASEAAMLGVALSLDSFGAGIGAAMLGFNPWLTAAVISVFGAVFLAAGLHLGFRLSGIRWMHRLNWIPGIMLMVMGLYKLWG